MRDLVDGKNIVVTGGAGALGQAIAQTLVEQGARVAALDIASHGLDAGPDNSCGSDALTFYELDLRRRDQLESALDALQADWGAEPDALVNCAGVFWVTDALPNPGSRVGGNARREPDWRAYRLPGFRTTNGGGGRRLNREHRLDAGIRGKAGRLAYGVSKHGVHGLTKALADEWGPRGVRVNTVAPGRIETPMTADSFSDEAATRAYLDRVPLGRFGLPEDITGPVTFLVSSLSSYITGQELVVDGGFTSNF